MARNTSGTDREQLGVTRRALLAAAGAAGLAATVTQSADADDKAVVERTFDGESADGKLQAALDKALEQLDKALGEGGVRDATATWKVAAIGGKRGTFKGSSTVSHDQRHSQSPVERTIGPG
jgi:hypothetical protein